MLLRRLLGKTIPGHYTLNIADNTIIVSYIRKNASTTIKRFFVGESRYSKKFENEKPLNFMRKYHGTIRSDFQKKNAASMVVIRDPVARLISLYLNKFVVRDGNSDIFHNYYKVTGKDPNEATFLEFIHEYIGRNKLNEVDCHALPQVAHLQPVAYTAPVRFEHLHKDVRLVLGEALTERYFARKSNNTKYADETELVAEYLTSPKKLIKQYHETGVLPNPKSFYCEELFEVIETKYGADQVVFKKLNKDYDLLGEKGIPKLDAHLDIQLK